MQSVLLDKVLRLINPLLHSQGYALVLGRFIGGQNRPTLQLLVEHADGALVTLDECAAISRSCSMMLEVENAIEGAYVLEVSSPGIDRPLVKPLDFAKFTGETAKVEMRDLVILQNAAPRKRFKGTILAADEEGVTLDQDGEKVTLPFDSIREANLSRAEKLLAPKQMSKSGGKKPPPSKSGQKAGVSAV